MSKVYIELICDSDVADELMTYPPNRVDIITFSDDESVINEMGGYDNNE